MDAAVCAGGGKETSESRRSESSMRQRKTRIYRFLCPICATDITDARESIAAFRLHVAVAHPQALQEHSSLRERVERVERAIASKRRSYRRLIKTDAGKFVSSETSGGVEFDAPTGRTYNSRAGFTRGRSIAERLPWDEDDNSSLPRSPAHDQSSRQSRTASDAHPRPQSGHDMTQVHFFGTSASSPDDGPADLVKQPETKPISQEQLVAEVKGIYAGLVMVENKCIEVDSAQSAHSNPRSSAGSANLSNEQWQALIALHRTLLHEHHDFFLASQHPSASPALRRLATKYAMPARMWRHGIHSFLELLRHRLPSSMEHMLTFIYLAYSMMALLYETVPAFEDTWIECLGDLGRYRMAIEDKHVRDRQLWTAVSRGWYSKASDKSSPTGRLYHHLAILARPNGLQQLFYYSRSLCVPIPVGAARFSNDRSKSHRFPRIDDTQTHGFGEPSSLRRRYAQFPTCGHTQFPLQDYEDSTVPTADHHPSMQEFIDHPDVRKRPTHVLRPLSILRSTALLRVLRFLAPFAFFSLSLASPTVPGDQWRIAKVLFLGCSAMGSFGTGMASLQIDMDTLSKKTQPADMGLRIGCSVALAVLAVLYQLWYLTNGRKARRFLEGVLVGSAVCWLFIRLAGSSSDGETDGGSFQWLDKLNLSGLLAVMAGILNAERGLFNSMRGQDDEGGGPGGGNGLRGTDHRRHEDDDPEDSVGHHQRGDGRRGRDAGTGAELADIGLGAATQAILGI